MKFEESFTVSEPPEKVWEFFEDLDRVAWCVPGVENVSRDEGDRLRVALTQKVGAVSATFEMKMEVSEKDPMRCLELSSTGKSVRGAAGQLRATNRVEFEVADGGTRVKLLADVAVAGTLSSVGQKVMESRAREAARDFAQALNAGMGSWARGEELPPPPPAPPARERMAFVLAALVVGLVVLGVVLYLVRRR